MIEPGTAIPTIIVWVGVVLCWTIAILWITGNFG